MGRLMDTVMTAFGVKPSDRVNLVTVPTDASTQNKPQQQVAKPITAEDQKIMEEIQNELPNQGLGGLTFFPNPKSMPNREYSVESKTAVTDRQIEESFINECVPVAITKQKEEQNPENCFGCKAVSGGVGFGLSGFALYLVKTNPHQYKGWKLISYRTGGILLALGKHCNFTYLIGLT